MPVCDVSQLVGNDEHDGSRCHLAGNIDAVSIEACRCLWRSSGHALAEQEIAKDRGDVSGGFEAELLTLAATQR